MWKKQYDQVYTRAGDVIALVQREPPVPEFDLGPLVVRLVQIFIGAFARVVSSTDRVLMNNIRIIPTENVRADIQSLLVYTTFTGPNLPRDAN